MKEFAAVISQERRTAVRRDPETDAIEAIEILLFSKRLDNPFTLPLLADLQLPTPAIVEA